MSALSPSAGIVRGSRTDLKNPSSLTERYPVMTGLWLSIVVVLSILLTHSHSPVRPLPGVVTILLLPGAWVMSAFRTRPSNTSGRLVLAVCLSMLAIMVIGFAASVIGPHVGLARPLDPLPQDCLWSFLGALMLAHVTRAHQDPIRWIFEGVHTSNVYGFLASGLLVVLSILGVAQLNHGGNIHLAVAATVIDVVVLVAGVVGGWSCNSRWPLSTLLYSASLALLLSASLRGGHLYGWDVQKEFGVATHTISAGRWAIPANRDPYASMLSLTVLPAVLSSLVKLRLLAFFQLVIPAILALLPVAIYSTVKSVPRFITAPRSSPRPGLAFAVVAALVVSSEAFSSQLVSITRQAMALTMLTALVMVLFDRTMPIRPSRVIIGLLIVGISFTHYTTSYLLAGIVLMAWVVSVAWSRGWLLTPKAIFRRHGSSVDPQKIMNTTLVVLALVAAFGWNLGVTRNYALTATSNAVTTKGAGFATSTGPVSIPAPSLEKVLERELHKSASFLKVVPGSGSVRLVTPTTVTAENSTSTLSQLWSWVNFVLEESLWVLAGVALLFGLYRFGRRRERYFTPDLVGFTASVLVVGGILRFSGTLAAFYSPSRAAIFVAIFVAAPVTMVLDDLVALLNGRFVRPALIVSAVVVGTMNVWATGLGTLVFGGVPPGSLTAHGVNAQDFTVSSSEFATAVWVRNHVGAGSVVQTDEYGQIVMLSEPANYDLLDEIVPTETGRDSYIYLSAPNLVNGLTTVTAAGGNLYATYRTTTSFFNRNFNVVYSTGSTRVYH